MNPDLEAIYQKVVEEPNEDTHKLVMADWLEEQGTPQFKVRAEFIRKSLALYHELGPDWGTLQKGPRLIERNRCSKLFIRYWPQWWRGDACNHPIRSVYAEEYYGPQEEKYLYRICGLTGYDYTTMVGQTERRTTFFAYPSRVWYTRYQFITGFTDLVICNWVHWTKMHVKRYWRPWQKRPFPSATALPLRQVIIITNPELRVTVRAKSLSGEDRTNYYSLYGLDCVFSANDLQTPEGKIAESYHEIRDAIVRIYWPGIEITFGD